jgi:hypothetical protein
MSIRATTLNGASQAARLRVQVTARRWEDARPVIGRTLSRRRTRVSDLRVDPRVPAAELVTLQTQDLPLTIRHRYRVRSRPRGQ